MSSTTYLSFQVHQRHKMPSQTSSDGSSIASLTSKQCAEQTHHIIKKLGHGAYAAVYLSIPKATADHILADYASSPPTKANKSSTITRLRASLQALKVSTSNSFANDPDKEIRVLQHLKGKCNHPSIIELIDADTSPLKKSWYTMPVCNGGDLDELLTLTRDPKKTALPVGLAWHICAQLGRALLYLHFGRHDGRTEPNWPLLTHEDIHPNNILFRAGGGDEKGQFGNYPDVILADFGKAWYLSLIHI